MALAFKYFKFSLIILPKIVGGKKVPTEKPKYSFNCKMNLSSRHRHKFCIEYICHSIIQNFIKTTLPLDRFFL